MSHSWTNNQASGNSRQINGNVYGNVTFGGDHYHDSNPALPDLQANVMDSLAFPEMNNYRSRPLRPRSGTYQWIFDEEKTNFVQWLRSSDALSPARAFWIHGKAGTGKSTLMRWLSEHKRTIQAVKQSGGPNVVIATFFVWNAGTKLEKTILGMLRSLLHQLLSKSPEMMEAACPRRYDDDIDAAVTREWGQEELIAALLRITDPSNLGMRFVLFIDGLDEFEEEARDVIAVLELVGKSKNVKLCLSGRPWQPYHDTYTFQRSSIAIQEHTEEDIANVIHYELDSGLGLNLGCRIGEASKAELCADVYRHSGGVFLWVSLALQTLRRGLEQGDGLEMLQERLELFPENLHDFIDRFFLTIEPAYRKYCARTLLAIKGGFVYLLGLGFLEIASHDPDFPFSAKVEQLHTESLLAHFEQAEALLNKWCKELVVMRGSSAQGCSNDKIPWLELLDRKVQFSHRTISDVVDERYNELLALAGPGYSPLLMELRLKVRLLKMASYEEFRTEVFKRMDEESAIGYICERLSNESVETRRSVSRLIQEVDEIGESLRNHSNGGVMADERIHWVDWRANSDIYRSRYPDPRIYRFRGAAVVPVGKMKDWWPQFQWPPEECIEVKHNILSLLLEKNLDPLLVDLLSNRGQELPQANKDFLLNCAIFELYWATSAGSFAPPKNVLGRRETIVQLLELGANPNALIALQQGNETYSESRIWIQLMRYVWNKQFGWWLDKSDAPFSRQDWEEAIDLIRCLLDHGADPDVCLNISQLRCFRCAKVSQNASLWAGRVFNSSFLSGIVDSRGKDPWHKIERPHRWFAAIKEMFEVASEAKNAKLRKTALEQTWHTIM